MTLLDTELGAWVVADPEVGVPLALAVAVSGAVGAEFGLHIFAGLEAAHTAPHFTPDFGWIKDNAPCAASGSPLGAGYTFYLGDANDMGMTTNGCGFPEEGTAAYNALSANGKSDVNHYTTGMLNGWFQDFVNGDPECFNSEGGDPGVAQEEPVVNGSRHFVLWISDVGMQEATECLLGTFTAPGSPDIATTVTAPAPDAIDFNAVKTYLGLDPSLGAYVNAQLAAAGATVEVPTADATWYYDGADTVEATLTVPTGVDQLELVCDDPESGVGFIAVTASQSVTLTRSGVGGLSAGDAFTCSILDSEDDVVASQALTFATAFGSPPDTGGGDGGTTGTTEDCSDTNVPAIDFGPLESLGLGTRFPFGVFSWVADGIAGWEGDSAAPSFSIPLLGVGHGKDVHVDMSFMDSEMPTIRGIFLIFFTVSAIVALASGTLGFGDGGGTSSE